MSKISTKNILKKIFKSKTEKKVKKKVIAKKIGKTKKIGRILSEDNSEEEAINYINKNFNSIKKPTEKILYDYANINKGFEKYEIAIEYYTEFKKVKEILFLIQKLGTVKTVIRYLF